MKKLLLFLTIISLSSKTKAQVVFCPPGAEWNFSFVVPMMWRFENEKITYIGDIVLNNETVKRLSHFKFFNENTSNAYTTLTYLKQNGDTVFMKNARTSNQWQILYNFAATPTQGWLNIINDGTSTPVQHYTTVDSTDFVTVNGSQLKRLFVTCNNNAGGVWRPGKYAEIIERFGNTTFLFNYTNVPQSSDDDIVWGFLCYRDNSFGLKQFSGLPCDYQTRVGIDEFLFDENQLSIYPNPVKDLLHLDFTNPPVENIKISILTILGQNVSTKNNMGQKENIDLSYLESGVYFIKLESQNNSKIIKILKE